ncbi:MAG: TIGR03905 family TSCPD domain-containing protein [Desulfovibrio sp.]|nr:TIGR03905 family TSCPD domain-containing protein [Desulfovibrio sp.]
MGVYSYRPVGVCSKRIDFRLNQGRIHDLHFEGGCPGNLQAIAKLLEGEEACLVIKKLKGNTCGRNPTSCADQLAYALEEALQNEASI